MPPPNPTLFTPTPSTQKTLHHLSHLLHLFHHRNKNQHRHTTWWRHFSLFRKQLNALLTDLSLLNEVPTTHLERVRKKGRDEETRVRISQRLEFWREVGVVRWWGAFSGVVADGRFAPLGLFLMAVLAQVCAVTGVTGEFGRVDQGEVERVLGRFGEEYWGNDSKEEGESLGAGEDVGEVVVRDLGEDDELKAQVLREIPVEAAIEAPSKSEKPVRTGKPPEKKRKKGDAIDDLFSSLD